MDQVASLEPTPQEERYQKIVEQVEYYFGDINLYKDRFLKVFHSDTPGGWLPLDNLMTFKHLRQITTNRNEVVVALKDRSTLVELNDTDDAVRRRRDIPEGEHEKVLNEYKSRSVYVGNLPLSATFDDLKEAYIDLYADDYGGIPSFVVRRDGATQKFRGSIYVTFNTARHAQQFLANPVANIFRGRILERMMQLDYQRLPRNRTLEHYIHDMNDGFGMNQ